MYDMSALYQAESVQDAIRLRLEHPEAQIIAGGTDVLVQMREGKRAGKALISIQGCREMRGVSLDDQENLRIGSLTTFSHITADPLIQRYINVLGEAVDMVGGPQIRNAGTIGGNTCNGVTSADSASTLHAWEAIIEITGKNGVRRVPIKDFYLKAGTVDLRAEEGEIQTAILIPKASYDRTFGHYIKYAMRNAMDIATLGTSVNARLSPDKKTFERVRIAFGVAGPVPLRALNAEAFINGRAVTLENIEQFGRTVLEDIHPDVQTVQDPDHRELPVDLLRSLRQDAYIRPNDGAAKVYIFPDCDALNQRDQNVLLKLVEEGPPYAAFLFCTETAAALLPTIRSRCVEWKLRGEDEDARDDAARDLCRAFASGQLLPVSQYLVGLENKRLKREQLQQLLENAWRASAEALLAACGKPDPADIPGAEELRRGLTVRQLQGMTDLMKQYCLECRYNVGVGHVLGALCAGWEKLL